MEPGILLQSLISHYIILPPLSDSETHSEGDLHMIPGVVIPTVKRMMVLLLIDDRYYRRSGEETPSHPGGVSTPVRETIQKQREKGRDRGVYAASSEDKYRRRGLSSPAKIPTLSAFVGNYQTQVIQDTIYCTRTSSSLEITAEDFHLLMNTLRLGISYYRAIKCYICIQLQTFCFLLRAKLTAIIHLIHVL